MVFSELIGLLVVIAFVIMLVRGGIQSFKRNWIAALLLLLFFTPAWIIWALVENFLDEPVQQPIVINVPPVQVNINQTSSKE